MLELIVNSYMVYNYLSYGRFYIDVCTDEYYKLENIFNLKWKFYDKEVLDLYKRVCESVSGSIVIANDLVQIPIGVQGWTLNGETPGHCFGQEIGNVLGKVVIVYADMNSRLIKALYKLMRAS